METIGLWGGFLKGCLKFLRALRLDEVFKVYLSS